MQTTSKSVLCEATYQQHIVLTAYHSHTTHVWILFQQSSNAFFLNGVQSQRHSCHLGNAFDLRHGLKVPEEFVESQAMSLSNFKSVIVAFGSRVHIYRATISRQNIGSAIKCCHNCMRRDSSRRHKSIGDWSVSTIVDTCCGGGVGCGVTRSKDEEKEIGEMWRRCTRWRLETRSSLLAWRYQSR
jgi:hypothetical protein